MPVFGRQSQGKNFIGLIISEKVFDPGLFFISLMQSKAFRFNVLL